MKAKLTLSAALLIAVTLIGCGGSRKNPTIPKFLVALDASGAGTNVNVFPVNATTGVLGAAVSGAPFDLGLTDPMTVVVHPNGHFVYVADGNDGSIHQWNVSESTGVPTDIAAKVVNSSGSFYEPIGSGGSDTRVLAITPKGKYLYSGNNDSKVGAYKINSNGSLSHIADLDLGACATGAIAATDSFVWVTDTCGNSGPWNVFTMKVGSNGSLTKTGSVVLTGVYGWLWSIQINPAGNLLYVGDEGGVAQIFGFKVATDGSLTPITLGTSTTQYQDNNSSDCRVIDFSPDGKFFYWSDDDDFVHSFSVDATTGAIAELANSPYLDASSNSVGGPGQIVVDVTGKFVYVADQDKTGGVIGFTRDASTGALTQIGTTATITANSEPLAIGIVR
jgi:6-phosphogluconolactonase (cycloisomerase 2 family)